MKKMKGMFVALVACVLFSSISCKKSTSSEVTEPNPPSVDGTLTVYPSPGNLSTVEHLTQSDDYIVEVRKSGETEYKPLFVYKTDNYWVNNYFGSTNGRKKTPLSASFTSFAFKGTSVDVKVTCKSAASTVTIRPLDFGINPVKNNNVITFTITDPKKLSIEVNNRLNPLFLFAEAPDVPNTKATYYYGPGVHNIGLSKTINSNESVYIAAGAVVEGSFVMPWNSKNISIKGRGILCMGEWPHTSTDVSFLGTRNAIKSNGTSNLSMEGLIIANSCGWTIPLYNSDNLTFNNQLRNLKIVAWTGNSDGIWVNGNGHVIDDCFIFNNDDIFMSHGATNCKISNIVAWGGPWGRLYMVSNQASTSNITFENINLIGKDGGPELILVDGESGTNLSVNNITFRNLRVESHPYVDTYNTNKFIRLISGYKSVNNWLFENVTVDDKNADEGDLHGSANSPINGIKFKNFKLGGVKVMSLTEANMDKSSFSSNITFE